MAKPKRASIKRKNADKSKPPAKKTICPYALVFYQAQKVVGVVQTKGLPADVAAGSNVLCSDPIDMPPSEQRFKATVIELGCKLQLNFKMPIK